MFVFSLVDRSYTPPIWYVFDVTTKISSAVHLSIGRRPIEFENVSTELLFQQTHMRVSALSIVA